jgi:ATP-dependent helicase/nuclease subunit A
MPDLLDLLALEGGHEGAMLALDTLRSIGTDRAALRRVTMTATSTVMDDVLRERLQAPEASVHRAAGARHGRGAAGRGHPHGGRTPADRRQDRRCDRREADGRARHGQDAGERWAIYRSVFRTASGDLRASNPYTKGMADALPLVAGLFQTKDGFGEEAHRMLELEDQLNRAAAFARTSAMVRVGLPALERYRALKSAPAPRSTSTT